MSTTAADRARQVADPARLTRAGSRRGRLPIRVGFGAMRTCGPLGWGDPPDRAASVRLLRCAADLGVGLIETADSHGPHAGEELVAEALHPYPGLTIATSGGVVRPTPGETHPLGDPQYLRQSVEMSLRRLRADQLGLYLLRAIDPVVPLADQLGCLDELRMTGKIARIGLGVTDVPLLARARLLALISYAAAPYSWADRRAQPVVDYCERHGLGFLAGAPLAAGRLAGQDRLARKGRPADKDELADKDEPARRDIPAGQGIPADRLDAVAREIGTTPAQAALAWTLHAAPAVLAVPGTTSAAHLRDNLAAATLPLAPDQLTILAAAPASPS